MKKAKVIMPFKDKTTSKVRNTGDEFECTAERLAELKAGRFVVEVNSESVLKEESVKEEKK